MTREEEIKTAADINATILGNVGPYHSFIKGAQWADKHPQSPWISIDDRLPEDNKTVLLWLGGCYKVALLRDNQWWECTGYQIERGWSALDALSTREVEYITHWMPIPKLKGE